MTSAFVDTDVIIRLVTGDDPAKQASAVALFERVEAGQLTLRAPVTVIADAVYVLHSRRLYSISRPDVRQILERLLQIRHFELDNKRQVIAALDVYSKTNLDFGDAMIVATMEDEGADALYSYDHDFDRIGTLTRHEP